MYDPRLVYPHPSTRVLSHQESSAFHVCILVFPICYGSHRSLCPTSPTRSNVCPTAHPPTSVKSPWHPPLLATSTPQFPCQERSNYTEISTEKDRLLLWHQRQGSCKSGAAAAAASGHCAGCRGALTSIPLFAPSLTSCLGL